jgi:phage anti-repressor protein
VTPWTGLSGFPVKLGMTKEVRMTKEVGMTKEVRIQFNFDRIENLY